MEMLQVNEEVWRPYLKDYYEVSNFGRVRSLDRMTEYAGGVSRNNKGCILGQFINASGYYTTRLHIDKKGKTFFIHRLVASVFLGEQPDLEINHKDGNKLNNKPDNLEWVTHAENLKHSYDTGLVLRGETHPNAQLTTEAVIEIKQMLFCGVSQGEVAEYFNVSKKIISAISSGSTWTTTGVKEIDEIKIEVKRGEFHPASKLNLQKASEIKELLRRGYSQKNIADRFGIHQGTVRNIAIGKNWKEAP